MKTILILCLLIGNYCFGQDSAYRSGRVYDTIFPKKYDTIPAIFLIGNMDELKYTGISGVKCISGYEIWTLKETIRLDKSKKRLPKNIIIWQTIIGQN